MLNAPTRPPGPPGHRWSGNLPAYESDRLGFLLKVRETYGGIVAFDTNTTIVNEPNLAIELLEDRNRIFDIRGNFLNERISADAAAQTMWVRRHLNPGMRMSVVEELGDRTGELVLAALSKAVDADGLATALDPLPLLEDALSRVVSEFYFGDEWELVRPGVGNLMDAIGVVFGSPFALPAAVPSPARLRIKRRYAALRLVVDRIVRARTKPMRANVKADFATVISQSGRSIDGLETARISDLIIGSLLAAHRVPAAGVAWGILELGCHVDLQDRLNDESSTGHVPTLQASMVNGPTLLSTIVSETLRLHPPTWLLHRTSSSPVTLGGFAFPAGHHFLVSPYVLHRDESQFPNAAAFVPERWREERRPQAFMPYGRGHHSCPGSSLATVMMTASLEVLASTWRIGSITRNSVEADPRSTLTPSGLKVSLISRSTKAEDTRASQLA